MKRWVKRAIAPAVRRWRGDRSGLPAAHWGFEVTAGGALALEGIDLPRLREQFGTPLHVVVADWLQRNVEDFLVRDAAGQPCAEVFYSYKTNPVPGVLRAMHRLGVGAEVISEFELWLALELGVPPAQIIYNGPAKSPASIRQAIEKDILLLNVNHREEIANVASVARSLGRRPRVGIRVTVASGWAQQFGCSIATGEALRAVKDAVNTKALDVTALHCHVGGMVRTAEATVANVGEVLAFTDRLRDELSLELTLLDLGGSLATPTVSTIRKRDGRLGRSFQVSLPAPDPSRTLSIRDFVRLVRRKVDSHYSARGRASPRVLLEPGRAMTGNAQFLLTSVVALKHAEPSPGWLILDAGINLAETMRSEYHEILPATQMHSARDRRYRLAGPICSPGDVISWGTQLPQLQVGDALAIMDVGAYFVPFSTSFSFPQPAIAMLDRGKVSLLRRAEKFADIVLRDEPDPAFEP